MLNQINNINTTLNGEIVTLDERLEKQLTNVEERLSNVEVHQGGKQTQFFSQTVSPSSDENHLPKFNP